MFHTMCCGLPLVFLSLFWSPHFRTLMTYTLSLPRLLILSAPP
jgi:hypothetical protein